MTRLLLIGLVACCAPLSAGLWDCDRPSIPLDHFDAITGKFDRPPAEYYRAREARLGPELDVLPDAPNADDIQRIADALPLFDDAAVAALRCGELGRAIGLLDRKARLTEAIRPTFTARAAEATARTSANKAVCLRIRWRSARDTEDLRHARELLTGVLEGDRFNSDALWSLAEIEWLLEPPAWQPGSDPVFPNLLGLRDSSFRGELDDSAPARNNVAGCLQFLGRRVVYEGGWQDVDVMYAYSLALALTGRSKEALFAWFRVVELIDQGATTAVPGAPAPTALKRAMRTHVADVPDAAELEKLYVDARQATDEWLKSRNEYALALLQQGRHPDTDPEFWSAWNLQPPAPGPGEPSYDPAISTELLVGGLGGLLLVLMLILGVSVVLGRRTPAAPNVDEL